MTAPPSHQARPPRERTSDPVRASEAYEIRTLSDFRLLLARPDGVIVITDSGSHAKAHRTNCRYLNENNFTKKVLEGDSKKRGSYYFFVRFDDAARELNAYSCMRCMIDWDSNLKVVLPERATLAPGVGTSTAKKASFNGRS